MLLKLAHGRRSQRKYSRALISDPISTVFCIFFFASIIENGSFRTVRDHPTTCTLEGTLSIPASVQTAESLVFRFSRCTATSKRIYDALRALDCLAKEKPGH